MAAETLEGDGYADLLPKLDLPPIIEIDINCLPKFWTEFCKQHRIRPYAILAYKNPLGQMKLWGASEILRRGILAQKYKGTNAAIDSTSGNFGEAMAWLIDEILKQDRSFPIKEMKAVVTHSTPADKVKRLVDRGIQPFYANDSLQAMTLAKEMAEKNGWWYLEQYWNPANSAGYEPIARHLAVERPSLGVISCGVGSGGSCSGIMSTLSKAFALRSRSTSLKLHRVAVVVEAGESVDGVRTEIALEPGTLPWRDCVEDVRFVGLQKSLECCAALWQQEKAKGDWWCEGGPSTGFALEGGLLSLRSLAAMKKLDPLRSSDGYVEFAFLAPDKRTPYREKFRDRSIYF